MKFELQVTDKASDARTGIITTDHGQIKTPIFMPVGTVGSVKGVHFEELKKQVMAQIICTSSTAGTVLSSPTAAASRSSRSPASASSRKKAASSAPTSTAASTSLHRRM